MATAGLSYGSVNQFIILTLDLSGDEVNCSEFFVAAAIRGFWPLRARGEFL